MYRTIQLSSCISVQGEIVEFLSDGTVLVRDGSTLYRGRPIETREPEVMVRNARSLAPELALAPMA